MIAKASRVEIRAESTRSLRGFAFLVIAVAFWGLAAPFGKHLIVTRFDTLTISQARVSLAFVLLALYFAVKNREFFRIRIGDLWKFAVLGVVGVALTNFTYYFTVKESTVATAILIQYSAPVWVLLYSVWVLREERLDWTTVIALAGALIGCHFAVTAGSMQSISLKGWALVTGPLSAFTFAYQVVATKQMLKRYPTWTVLLYSFGFATLFWLFVNPPWAVVAQRHSGADWGFLWLFAVVSILIPQAAFAFGLRLTDASKAGVVLILEPVFAIGLAYVMLGEALSAVQGIGAAIVLGAIALLEIHPRIRRG